GPDRLVGEVVALREGHAQGRELGLQVASRHAEDEAAAGEDVEARGRLRGEEGVPVGEHVDEGEEPDARGGGGGDGEGEARIEVKPEGRCGPSTSCSRTPIPSRVPRRARQTCCTWRWRGSIGSRSASVQLSPPTASSPFQRPWPHSGWR